MMRISQELLTMTSEHEGWGVSSEQLLTMTSEHQGWWMRKRVVRDAGNINNN